MLIPLYKLYIYLCIYIYIYIIYMYIYTYSTNHFQLNIYIYIFNKSTKLYFMYYITTGPKDGIRFWRKKLNYNSVQKSDNSGELDQENKHYDNCVKIMEFMNTFIKLFWYHDCWQSIYFDFGLVWGTMKKSNITSKRQTRA